MFNVEEYEKENRLNPRERKTGEYCTALVVNGYSDEQKTCKYWWWMLEGSEIFCRIERCKYTGTIKEFWPCRLQNNKILIGRSIKAEDCMLT